MIPLAQLRWLVAIATSGFLVVALGAFAAHGLQPHLTEQAQHWFELATRYQMWHTLALSVIFNPVVQMTAVKQPVY